MNASSAIRPGVLMVTGAYFPELSGGGLQCKAIIDALRVDVRFAVLTTSTDAALPANDTVDGTPVRRVYIDVSSLWSRVMAAYLGGSVDNLMMRFVDVLDSLPNILFVMLGLMAVEAFSTKYLNARAPEWVAGLHLTALFVLIGAVSWLNMARVDRGQVLSLRTRPFVLASRALGAGHFRILRRQILPNVLGLVIVYLSLTVPTVILYESFLSFLGRGILPPQASLGTLIADGAGQLNPLHIRWWLVGFPAGLLGFLMLALTFLGDGLRAALDPKADR